MYLGFVLARTKTVFTLALGSGSSQRKLSWRQGSGFLQSLSSFCPPRECSSVLIWTASVWPLRTKPTEHEDYICIYMQIGTTITRVGLIIKTYISLPHLHCNLCSLTSTHSSSTLLYPCQLPYIYFRTARCFSFPLKERHWDPRQLHLKNTHYVLTFSKKLSENRKGSNDLLWRIWNVTLNSNPDVQQVVWLQNTLHTFQMNRRTASTSAGEARQPAPLQPVAIINMFGFIPRAYKKKILKASSYTIFLGFAQCPQTKRAEHRHTLLCSHWTSKPPSYLQPLKIITSSCTDTFRTQTGIQITQWGSSGPACTPAEVQDPTQPQQTPIAPPENTRQSPALHVKYSKLLQLHGQIKNSQKIERLQPGNPFCLKNVEMLSMNTHFY